ncbi:MAG: hypothetical protein K0R59_2743 [Sphingobacterium sp.]|jgi:hypothetical protein|nr:hypothetical protein [Sphingobacterium sp.]
MPTAKEDFIKRLNTFKSIIYPETPSDINLNSGALNKILHNDKVRMLRNGMSIIGFTILEDFVKRRTGEILKDIGSTSSLCSFNNLPDKLKEAVTFNALKGITARADMLRRNSEDHIQFVQEETSFISSTKNSVFELSSYSIGWEKSNITDNDIKDILSIFHVEGGWNAMQTLSSIFNSSIIQPNTQFKNFASNRHKAAHNTNTDSAMNDLIDFENQSKIIAVCFDSLVSKSLSYIVSNNSSFLNSSLKTKPNDIKFRTIKYCDSVWKEYNQNNNSRAFRVNNDYNILLSQAKSRSQSNKEVLIIKNEDNSIKDWFIFT